MIEQYEQGHELVEEPLEEIALELSKEMLSGDGDEIFMMEMEDDSRIRYDDYSKLYNIFLKVANEELKEK